MHFYDFNFFSKITSGVARIWFLIFIFLSSSCQLNNLIELEVDGTDPNSPEPSVENPISLFAVPATISAIQLNWSNPPSSTGYVYLISYQEGLTPPEDCLSSQISLSDSTLNAYLVKGLDINKDYSFRICSKKNENISNGITVSTKTLDGVNTPPIALKDYAVVLKNKTIDIHVLENDSDVDLDVLTITNATSDSGIISHDGKKLIFSPDLNNTNGVNFSYTVDDGNGGSASVNGYVRVLETQTYRLCSDTKESSEPNGTLYDSGGASGAYGNGFYFRCYFKIIASPGANIHLTINSFSVDNLDFLRIYDGELNSGTLIGEYKNSNPPPATINTTNGVVLFIFDGNQGGSIADGFDISWNITYPGNPITLLRGSPYSSKNESRPLYIIGINSGSLNFSGQDSSSNFLNLYSLSSDSTWFMTSNKKETISLSVTDSIFLTSSIQQIQTLNDYVMCTDFSSTDVSGFLIDSGGDADPYSAGENCTFLINPANASKIILELYDFDVEGYGGTFDRFYIYDGYSTSDPVIAGPVSHSFYERFASTNGAMFLRWTSDGGVQKKGYRLRWSSE